MKLRAINSTRGTLLATRVEIADTLLRRMMGLMFRATMPAGAALLLTPCNQIHTHWMRFPIDALFLDGHHRVVAVRLALAPFRFEPSVRGAHSVLELPAGTAIGTCVGDQVTLDG